MKLLIHKVVGNVLDASNVGEWQAPGFAEVIEVPGDAETFNWPHPNGPSACIWDGANIIANSAVPLPVDKDAELDAAIQAATSIPELKNALKGRVRHRDDSG